jgi:CO dehydrogenase maturation factor
MIKEIGMQDGPRFISLSGKGGSGKTTTISLLLAALLRQGKLRDILVIDADPDANLARTLGVEVTWTVGNLVDKRKKELDELGGSGTKMRFLVWDALCQGPGFDLLVMGRSSGEGCYCSVNTVLGSIFEDIVSKYECVLIDFDAGIEHFSRRACNPADTLIITCDPSRLSFDTAGRIVELVRELSLPYERIYTLGCRYTPEQRPRFYEMTARAGLTPLGLIEYDLDIVDRNLTGKSLLDLDHNSPAMVTAECILDELIFD